MDEVENTAVVSEVAAPEATPEVVNQSQTTPVDNRQDRNWREMRRINSELERKAKMQEEMIAQLLNTQKTQSTPIVDELDNVPDEDYIPKGQVKKLLSKERDEARRIAQEEARKILQEQEKSQFMTKLKGKFSDFDDIVTPETLELLETQDPELAKTIADIGDPYSMGLQTYKYIKSMNLSEKVPSSRRAKEVDKKIEQNSKTIQSPQAYEKRPIAQTFQLTESAKSELYKEMMGFARQASGVPPLG